MYNPQSKTYCKRLQVLCPEHSRDPKVHQISHFWSRFQVPRVSDVIKHTDPPSRLSPCQVTADEVCGCPLVKDVFEPTGEFCRVSKRKCNKHYCWEKLRRAEVDLERVRVVTRERL